MATRLNGTVPAAVLTLALALLAAPAAWAQDDAKDTETDNGTEQPATDAAPPPDPEC